MDDGTAFADKFTDIGIGGKGAAIQILNNNSTLDANLSGDFYFDIYSDWQHMQAGNPSIINNSTNIKEFWITNFEITIVDINTLNEIGKTDIEYIGILDENFKDEGEKVSLICGTDNTKADKGKLMYLSGSIYKPIKQWTRANQTFKIEELLLNSLSSNYKSGFYSLSNVILNNSINQLNIIKDSKYLGSRQFMLNAYTVNYQDNEVNCSLIEISADNNTITQ